MTLWIRLSSVECHCPKPTSQVLRAFRARHGRNEHVHMCIHYIHISQNRYMYIMIHTYVNIYTCGFSVCVWVGERVCVASLYSQIFWPIDTKNNHQKVVKYNKQFSVERLSTNECWCVLQEIFFSPLVKMMFTFLVSWHYTSVTRH